MRKGIAQLNTYKRKFLLISILKADCGKPYSAAPGCGIMQKRG